MSKSNNSTPAFSVENLPVITHQHRPVLTTELLALGYGTKPKNIHDNFRRNVERFVAGKHYFKLEGAELAAFKDQLASNRPAESGSVGVGRNTRSVILWTERGAARHAKLLNTDKAWEVFEKLEDAYFSQATETSFADLGLTFKEQIQLDRELRISIESLGKIKQAGLVAILRARIVRLCRRLGYEVPEVVLSEQQSLEGV